MLCSTRSVHELSLIHILIVTEIWKVLREYISEKAGECMPLASPIDVQLDCDDKTMAVSYTHLDVYKRQM